MEVIMKTILDFKNKEEFRTWLKENHNTSKGVNIFMYKKEFSDLGLTYEDAVKTALCYGWIDAVTHSYDEQKFIQYFAKRKKGSNWSLSNIKRVKDLIDSNEMTENGLNFFDMNLLSDLDHIIEDSKRSNYVTVEIPEFFRQILVKEHSLELFLKETKSAQSRYINYILSAKKEDTKIRRCHKIISILNGDKNNL